MKIAIVQFDNRPLEQLGGMAFLVARNRDYAVRHGYEHRFLDKAYFDLPVYWQKPSICGRVLEAGYDLVAWLDTDAVVHDLDRRLEDLFDGPEAMVAAGDAPPFVSPFNAGVFLARGPQGARIMQRWAGLFPREAWTRTETAWICRETWAGPAFEQGAFAERLVPELVACGELKLTGWTTLQSPAPQDGAFVLHFAGRHRANLAAYVQTL